MESSTDLHPVPVVCLVLRDRAGYVLATQRPAGKKLGSLWEFPGGKVEASEHAEAALRRELREELELNVGPLTPLMPVDHTYPFGPVHLIPFQHVCENRPELELKEHSDARWIRLKDWEQLDWAPADLPVIEQLLDQEN